MNKTPQLKPTQTGPKPVPISKKCRYCKQTRLLSDFQFDMSLKTKDHRARTCNSCMEKMEEEEKRGDMGHTTDCIEGKFLGAVAAQLDTLLALSENGMLIPDEILDIMAAIFEQDEKNMADNKD